MSAEIAVVGNGDDSSQMSSLWTEEKGSRNKRKFLSDLVLGDPSMPPSSIPNECQGYAFSSERFQNVQSHDQYGSCKMCHCNLENPVAFKPEVSVLPDPSPAEISAFEFVRSKIEQELKGIEDADWNDRQESLLEELCLTNLDSIFKSAIKMIVASGYSEDVATKAVLRTDLFYGCKDTVSNIVDNTLASLQTGQDNGAARDNFFKNLEQLEKYLLAEMVCVLREVNPLFNTGEAMWCLLICDMNVSHACALEGDSLNCFGGNEVQEDNSHSVAFPLNSKANDNVENHPNTSNSNSSVLVSNGSQSELPEVKGIPNLPNPKSSLSREESPIEKVSPAEKASPKSTCNTIKKTLGVIEEGVQAKSQSSNSAEKLLSGRKGQSSGSKRESILRQKIQLEKNYRGTMRTGKLSKLGGMLLDKKLKSVSDCIGMPPKNAFSKIKKSMEFSMTHAEVNRHLSVNVGTSNSSSNKKTAKPTEVSNAHTEESSNPAVNVGTSGSAASDKKIVNTPPVLPKPSTEQSVSLPSKDNTASSPTIPSDMHIDASHYGIPYDRTIGKWVPNDKQDEVILGLVARAQDLQNLLREWTDWANQKVTQATCRLSKDRAELKMLRQEKEEVERIQKEQKSSEESTVRKLSEMENALSKATEQVEQADASVRRLELENCKLRLEMELAKKQFAEATASCKEASKREKKIKNKLQSLEMQKASLQEELVILKRRRVQLEQEIEQAQKLLNQLEARMKFAKKENEELRMQAQSIRKERDQIELSTKIEEDAIRMKSGNDLQRHKDDIRNLENQIFQLSLETDTSKMPALQWGNELNAVCHQQSETLKRDRECVMCLTEEMSVVFLPCAHQVVCKSCNELHKKQGMEDCPSCRTLIKRRICTRFYNSS